MAIIQLSDTWPIRVYAVIFAAADKGEPFDSPFLRALEHFALPGLKWQLQIYPRGAAAALPDFATVSVYADFARQEGSVTSVWAAWTVTVLAKNSAETRNISRPLDALLPNFFDQTLGMDYEDTGVSEAFRQDYLTLAVNDNGCLELLLDLEIYKIVDILECRDTVRALLSDDSFADFVFKVEDRDFRVHKAFLASQGGGFVEHFQGESNEAVLTDAKADAFAAFIGGLYYENFEFLSVWKLTVGVLKLASKFGVNYLKQYCDDALAELMPNLGVDVILQVLLEAMRCDALSTKSVCSRILADRKDVLTSAEWMAFKAREDSKTVRAIYNLFLQNHCAGASAVFDVPPVRHAAEVTLRHTWAFSDAELLRAIQPRVASVKSSACLQHKAFPGLKWQAEFYPRGNADAADFTPGYTSLYLKADFAKRDSGLRAVYAKLKATITSKDGQKITVPGKESSNYFLFTAAKDTRNGYANAFRFEQFNDDAPEIEFQLTIASIPDIIKCRDVIKSLYPDLPYSNVELDVSGTIFKAHKGILAARSAVFAKMFHADMAENKTGVLEVKDATPEAFEYFLAAVYYDSWDFLADVDDTLDILTLAERYAVIDLKRYCDEALAHFVDGANVFDLLIVAALHNADATKAVCVRILFAKEGFAESDGWSKFKEAVGKEIAFDVIKAISKHYRLTNK